MTDEFYQLERVKRQWVPEWLWYIAVHPIPFMELIAPEVDLSIHWLTHLLSTDDKDEIARAVMD